MNTHIVKTQQKAEQINLEREKTIQTNPLNHRAHDITHGKNKPQTWKSEPKMNDKEEIER